MKKYLMGRKVVIMQQNGKGNIEQAIFILKEEVKEPDSDYVLKEARKIVDEFVHRNGMKKTFPWFMWFVPVGTVCVVLALFLSFLF